MPAPVGVFQRLLKKRIPTLLGLGVLVVGVVAGILLVGEGTGGFLPRASEDAVPKQVRITNITDTGFTVSFLTDLASPGFLTYGTEPGKTNVQVRDDRDQLANSVTAYRSHHISVRGLKPSTQYYFLLGTSGRASFDNNGQPFSVRTARQENTAVEAATAYGNVANEVGNPVSGAIVYLTIQGASPLSALVKANGSWAVPLAGLRSLDLSSLAQLSPDTNVKIQVQGERQNESMESLATVKELSPLPTLVMSRAAGAGGGTGGQTATNPQTKPATPQPITPPSAPPATASGSGSFAQLYSNQEAQQSGDGLVEVKLENNEVIYSTRPEFVGEAPASSYLQIEVHSDEPYYGVVQTDANGNWEWSPPGDLSPGEHAITVTYTDRNGVQQKVQRTFLVQAGTGGNNLPAFTSSPSGVLATPTPKPSPSPTPTLAPTPTPTPTPVPTPRPTPTPVASQSAQPVSGSTTTTLALIAVSLVCFIFGALSTQMVMTRRTRQW